MNATTSPLTPNQKRLSVPPGAHLWQRRFYDFNVWSHGKKTEKLQYMHFNPLKRGLVRDPKDCPWSSYGFYAGHNDGLLKIDSP